MRFHEVIAINKQVQCNDPETDAFANLLCHPRGSWILAMTQAQNQPHCDVNA